jgi:CBS domain-containing protein
MSNGDARAPHVVGNGSDAAPLSETAPASNGNGASSQSSSRQSSSRHRKPIQEALDELGAAREVARQQLRHLSDRAKDGQKELGTNLTVLEERFERGADKAREVALVKARELARGVQGFFARHGVGRRSLAVSVATIMNSNIATCGPDDTLDHVAQIMWDHDCGIVPVVGASGQLVGVITDRDICMASHLQGRALGAANVGSAMSRQLYTCAPDDPIEQALSLMSSKQIRRLPVVHADGRLAGLVALGDLTGHSQALSAGSIHGYARVGLLLAAILERRGVPHDRAHAAE